MRLFWTVFWTFLLSQMLVYVISSMTRSTYDFMQGVFLTVIFSIIVIFLGEVGVTNDTQESNQ